MNRKFAVGIALAFLAAVGWRWQSRPAQEGSPPQLAAATPSAPVAATPRRAAPAIGAAPAPVIRTPAEHTQWAAALPKAETPLIETMALLKAAAEAGNAVAGCRLAAQLNRCREQPQLEREASRLEDFLKRFASEKAPQPALVERLDKNRKRLAEITPICAGVPIEETKRAWQISLTAAQSGYLPAMVAFAVDPPLDSRNFLAQMDGWDQYRQNAPAQLEQAVQAGDRRAIEWMAMLLTGERVDKNAGFTLPANPERALSLYLLLAKLPPSNFIEVDPNKPDPGKLERLRNRIGAAGVQRAETAADQLFHAQFAGRPDLRPLTNNELDSAGRFCENPSP